MKETGPKSTDERQGVTPWLMVEEATTLTECLQKLYPESSRSSLKRLLEHGRVSVNGSVVKVGATLLRPGDRLEVGKKSPPPPIDRDVSLVHEDRDLIVVEKRAGLLTIATARESRQTAFRYLSAYVKRSDPGNKIFIVHRLDQEASGLLVFARSERVKRALQALFQTHRIDRRYVAVVEGEVRPPVGVIRSSLAEAASGRVYVTTRGQRGKAAVTQYRVLRQGAACALLELGLETGRKHQIRVHLAERGHPIVGDALYGQRSPRLSRMALHARRLGFVHPVTGEPLLFETEIPSSFLRLVGTPKPDPKNLEPLGPVLPK